MDSATQAQMWNELRDTANYNRQSYENERNRLVGVVSSALSNEAFMTDDAFSTQRKALFEMLEAVSETVESSSTGGASASKGLDKDGNEYVIGEDSNGNRFNVDTNGDGKYDTYVDLTNVP